MNPMKKIILSIIICLVFFQPYGIAVAQQASSSTCVPVVQECKDKGLSCTDCESYLQNQSDSLKGQADSLSSQIAVMDNQIQLTSLKIDETEQQISDLTLNIDTASKKINSIQSSLENLTKVLISRIRATYEVGSAPAFQVLLASSSVSDFVTRDNYLKLAQEHDKKLIIDTVQAKDDYSNQKNIFQDQKKQVEALNAQLQSYTAQLDQQKAQENQLLAETQGSEATYEQELAQTKAQLAAFQGFVTSQGGASLLGNQTVCDDWGCYYNQRDSQWGGNSLNGTGYTLADSGCLITAMAMVYTHAGHRDVTPQSINSNSGNFGGIPQALLKYSIVANGVSSQRVGASIDSDLSGGNPVIVGISYDGGPLADHFVVLVSGSGGNYIMNDPYTPNGHNIPFTSHYSLSSIVYIGKVTF